MSDARRRFEELRQLFPEEPDLVMVEEFAEEIARRMPRAPKPRRVVTRTLDRKDQAVKGTYDIINTNLPGMLREFTIRSPSSDFSIFILADGMKKLSRTYAELVTLSPHSETVNAYEEAGNGVYVVHIKEIHWLNSFLATIYINGTLTFQHIFAVWDEFVT